MSLINNIPFDINRTPVEKNTSVKKGGTVPVQHSDAMHPVEKEIHIKERRNGSRRKKSKAMQYNKRRLGERRESPKNVETSTTISEKVQASGSIIDLEV